MPTSLRPIFDTDADKDTLYSEERVCTLLKGYMEREGLVAGKGAITLDKCVPPINVASIALYPVIPPVEQIWEPCIHYLATACVTLHVPKHHLPSDNMLCVSMPVRQWN